MRKAHRIALLLFVALSIPGTAAAGLIGVTFGGDVVQIDPLTGAGATIGPSGFGPVNSLADDGLGTLFTVLDDAFSVSHLITIDPLTGAGVAGATVGFIDTRALALSPTGVLYAINQVGSSTLDPDNLITIDVTTGAVATVGSVGLSGIQSLDFSPTGVLYGWDGARGLVTIDLLTAVATDVNLAIGGGIDIQSIAFGPDGMLYGARDALFTIDSSTGAATLVGAGGYSDVRGIAFTSVTSVPEPASFALFGAGVLAVGLARRRCRGSSSVLMLFLFLSVVGGAMAHAQTVRTPVAPAALPDQADMMKLQTAMIAAQAAAIKPGDEALPCEALQKELVSTMNDPAIQEYAAKTNAAYARELEKQKTKGLTTPEAAAALAAALTPGMTMAGMAPPAIVPGQQMTPQQMQQAMVAQQQATVAYMNQLAPIMPVLMRSQRVTQLAVVKNCTWATGGLGLYPGVAPGVVPRPVRPQ